MRIRFCGQLTNVRIIFCSGEQMCELYSVDIEVWTVNKCATYFFVNREYIRKLFFVDSKQMCKL